MVDQNRTIPDGMMVCQLCHGDGSYVETYLVNDGIPGTVAEMRSKVVQCNCDDGLLEDPEADL